MSQAILLEQMLRETRHGEEWSVYTSCDTFRLERKGFKPVEYARRYTSDDNNEDTLTYKKSFNVHSRMANAGWLGN